MKIKNKIKLLHLISFGFVTLLNANNAFAVTMTEYPLKGSNPETNKYSSAPAYTITGSEYFPDGTILYKQTYYDVTYYSPKPNPKAVEAQSGEKSYKYRNWDLHEFKPNGEKNPAVNSTVIFRTNYYYKEATVTQNATAYGINSSGSRVYETIVPAGTKLKVKSITTHSIYNAKKDAYEETDFIYFDTTGTNAKSYNKIARIERKYVKKSSTDTIKQIFFDDVKNRTKTVSSTNSKKCSDYYDNFKPYRTHADRYNGSSDDNLTVSPNKVPSSVTTCNLGGKSGEWKYLGVSSKGNVIANPYYPGDLVSFMGNGSLKYYDWRTTPWSSVNPDNSERDTFSGQNRINKIVADAKSFRDLYDAPTFYDDSYNSKKIEILQKIINDGVQPVNGTKLDGSKITLTASQWASRVSLLTNPYDETPIFVGQRRAGDYSQPFAYISPINDIYLSSIVVKNYKGDIVASGTRSSYNSSFTSTVKEPLKKGGCYSVEVKVSKKTNDALKSTMIHADLQMFSSLNTSTPFVTHKMSLPDKGGLTSGKNTSGIMYYSFIVPENFKGTYYNIESFISLNHAGIDNLDYSNDNGAIKINISNIIETFDKGDMEPSSIKLLDGTTTVYDSTNPNNKTAIIPGKKYSIVYTAKYTGESLYAKKFDGTKWINDTSKPYKAKVPLSYSITRKVGKTQSNDGVSNKTGYFQDSSGNQTITMSKNKTFTYTVKDIVLEHTYLNTSFKITSTDEKSNKDTSNDSLSKTINDTFSLTISNLKVQPSKEYILGVNSNFSYNVTYDAKLTTPTYITSSNYKTLVTTSININGTTKTFVNLLKPNTTISHISHNVSGISVGTSTGPYYCEVILNSDKKIYASGGTPSSKVAINFTTVKNPSTSGKNSDTAKTPFNGANTTATKGGDANNNCLIPRNTNKYNSKFTIYNWTGTKNTYSSFSGTNSIDFYKYNISSETSKTVSNSENFIIKDVLFKSKYTKDKKLGTKKDGWVSMINSTDSIIKAGYGFELKIIVEYKTNAVLNNPATSNNTTSGTFVTNLNSGINIIPELFVEIPGTTKRTILSVYSHTGTKQGLSVKKTKNNVTENSMQVSEWEYTIKETNNSSGIKSAGKIFTPETLKNGKYKLSIYTPPVSGVSSLDEYNTFTYSSLCDRKDTYVTIQGVLTDDLNTHTIQ